MLCYLFIYFEKKTNKQTNLKPQTDGSLYGIWPSLLIIFLYLIFLRFCRKLVGFGLRNVTMCEHLNQSPDIGIKNATIYKQ